MTLGSGDVKISPLKTTREYLETMLSSPLYDELTKVTNDLVYLS